MRTHDIDAILEDLYAIEPALKADEPRLRALVAELIAARPDTRFDERFARELRAKLAAAPGRPSGSVFNSLITHLMNLKSPLIPAGVIAVVALVALVLTQQPGIAPQKGGKLALGSAISIEAAGARAFGSLNVDTAAVSANLGLRSQAGGGSGIAAPAASPAPEAATSESAKIASDLSILPYEPINYRFLYKGEMPELAAEQVVYKRLKGDSLPADAFRGLNLGLLDLNRFSSAKLQSFNLIEDRDFGYAVYVDGIEGMVSISQNWMKWPNPGANCRDEACWQALRMTADQIPSDAEAIAMADKFLSDYGIAKDAYGAPVVRNEWRVQYERAADKSLVYVPESVSVVYPLMIDGRAAIDEAGYPTGLTVNVNARHKRVDGVWNLATNRYQSSTYAGVTDAAKLLSVVEKGGVWGWTDPNAAKTVEIELGAPELVLTKMWVPRAAGAADELLVPALRFPVLNPPADQPWFRDNVTVPLAQELLEQSQPPITIMEKAAPAM